MTAPVPIGTPTTSNTSSTTTSHSITMPSGVTAGEYLMVFAQFHSDDSTNVLSVGSPGGFWILGLGINAFGGGSPPRPASAREVFRSWYMLCSGTESGSTMTVSTNVAAVSAMIATRVDPNTVGSVANAGQVGFVGSDPPSVPWPSGTYDTLAFTIFWLVDNTPTFSALSPPSGYTLIGDVVSTGVGFGGGTHNGHARIGLAYKVETNVGSVDPGSWSGIDASTILVAGPGTYLWRNDEVDVEAHAYWGIDATVPA